MKHSKLTCSKFLSTKQVLLLILFVESLAITLAIKSAIANALPPDIYFQEKGFITHLSFVQLLLGAILAGNIYATIKHSPNTKLARNALLWLIISLGLIFLALDDILSIHEQIDSLTHDLLRIEETNITDLADDLIIGLYLLIFLTYVFFQRRAIGLFKPSFIFFIIGFGLTIVMIIFDTMSNNTMFTSAFFNDGVREKIARQWLGVIEDSAKIFAEGMFIVGIYKCREIVNSLNIEH